GRQSQSIAHYSSLSNALIQLTRHASRDDHDEKGAPLSEKGLVRKYYRVRPTLLNTPHRVPAPGQQGRKSVSADHVTRAYRHKGAISSLQHLDDPVRPRVVTVHDQRLIKTGVRYHSAQFIAFQRVQIAR